MESRLRRIAAIGNYLPRQCGIATFTTDICEALAAEFKDTSVIALPVNDTDAGYPYPPRVRFELAERELASYRRAADFLNINDIDIVLLQHEFGIFGGPAGSHILALLNELRMPVVTTLHTVLREPNSHQRKVMDELAQLSDRLIVMSEHAVEFLRDIYDVPGAKIDMVHHGIPDVPFVDPNFYKDKFAVEGKTVLLTFGLLSPNKGIEYAIEALPIIREQYADVVYIVLGATHPHLIRHEGESYRLSLQRLAKARGVEENVIFHNRFVSIEELVEFIGAADVYITPYLNEAQITSGTLAYSVGAGKAVVSTPYWYAEELLADRCGVLVPFKDSEAIAQRVTELLDNEVERHAMRKRAYMLGREMVWKQVARQYMASFKQALEDRSRHPRVATAGRVIEKLPWELPPLKLEHLHRLTDHTGVLQHATFSVPNYTEGYTTDDNARALVLTVLLEEMGEHAANLARQLGACYMGFLSYAFNPETGRFRNYLSYDRHWGEEIGSEDCHGRAIWGLGTVAGRSNTRGLSAYAGALMEDALAAAPKFESPRAWAFTLMGIQEFFRRFYGHRLAQDLREQLGERLLKLYNEQSAKDWPWFEDVVTYANAVLPHTLMLCGQWLERSDMVEAALASLDWLTSIQRIDGNHFVPIGNHGFYPRGGTRARFDQLPGEAYATVSACLEAHRMTGEDKWMREAQRAFEWFLGGNDLGVPVFDPTTGGCYDGLHPERVNQNQGAESTLSFLLALMEMNLAQHVIREPDTDETPLPPPEPEPPKPTRPRSKSKTARPAGRKKAAAK